MTTIETLNKIIADQLEEQKLRREGIQFKREEILKYRKFIIKYQERIAEIEKEIAEASIYIAEMVAIKQQLEGKTQPKAVSS